MPAPVPPLRWLRGDLHTHCEQPEQVEAYLEGVAGHLDFIALTNHAQKPAFQKQQELVARMRELLPGLPIFFGLEWNTPSGDHACLIFPPSPREAAHACEFARRHDRLAEGHRPAIAAALDHLAALPEGERPLLFFNHPAPGQWPAQVMDRYLEADRGGIVIGIEAVHGHQTHERVLAMDPVSYPGAAIGGLADHVYQRGRPFSLLANSDFHIHKQHLKPDYPPGVFNHIRAGAGAAPDAAAIFAALRQGRTCAVQGHWLELVEFAIGPAQLGDTWRGEGEGALAIALEAGEELAAVDVIGQLSRREDPRLLAAFGPQPPGRLHFALPIPAGARGFVRLRAMAASPRRPAPGQIAPRLFLGSAILIEAG